MRYAPDRSAIITGAGTGIGRAIATRLVDEGVRVVVASYVGEAANRNCPALRVTGERWRRNGLRTALETRIL
jgi:NAD(P)-dependent dehydrogenase (short-subunit alcohol dehydrogenase family)